MQKKLKKSQLKRLNSKSNTEFEHARRRFKERFDVEYTRSMEKTIIQQVQTLRNATFIMKQSNRVSAFKVRHGIRTGDSVKFIDMTVIYDKIRKRVVTVWPYDPVKDVPEYEMA